MEAMLFKIGRILNLHMDYNAVDTKAFGSDPAFSSVLDFLAVPVLVVLLSGEGRFTKH